MLKSWLKPPRIHALSALWALLILILSAIPGRDMPKVDLIQADKFAHAFVYGVLTFLLSYSFRATEPRSRYVLEAGICSLLYGVLMEFMQDRLFEERFFDGYDVLANAVGVVLGSVIIWRILRTK